MNKRVLLAGVLGGLAMFVWTFLAHMVLPLGEAGVKQIDNDEPLLGAMRSTLSSPGFYLYPKMAPGNDPAEYQHKLATGPSGMLIYLPHRDFSFGAALGTEFVSELLQALLATLVVSSISAATFTARVSWYGVIGIIAAAATNLSYWNWYGFPSMYTAVYMLTIWLGYICAGLVAAAMMIRRVPVAALATSSSSM